MIGLFSFKIFFIYSLEVHVLKAKYTLYDCNFSFSNVYSISVAQLKKKNKKTLTVDPLVEMLHGGSPEGHIPSRCISPSRRCVWCKPYCCPVEHNI